MEDNPKLIEQVSGAIGELLCNYSVEQKSDLIETCFHWTLNDIQCTLRLKSNSIIIIDTSIKEIIEKDSDGDTTYRQEPANFIVIVKGEKKPHNYNPNSKRDVYKSLQTFSEHLQDILNKSID